MASSLSELKAALDYPNCFEQAKAEGHKRYGGAYQRLAGTDTRPDVADLSYLDEPLPDGPYDPLAKRTTTD